MAKKRILLFSLTAVSLLVASTESFAARYYKGDDNIGMAPVRMQTRTQQMPMKQPCYSKQSFDCIDKGFKDGFYIGIEGGADSYRARDNITASSGGNNFSSNAQLHPIGFVGGAFLGYGHLVNDYLYLGGELFALASEAQSTYAVSTNSVEYVSQFNANASYGIALHPGIKVNNNSLAYLRIGYTKTRFKTQESLTFTTTTRATNSRWKGGTVYGLGLETAIYNGVSLRGEYTYTKYQSFRTPLSTTFTVSDNQFLAGVLYHFG